MTRYGIQHIDGRWWRVGNRWTRCNDPASARWFDSMTEAELAALRELPDRRDAYSVQPIPISEAV